MGIIIDIIIILFILVSVFLAYKKGLISLAINLVAFIIAIVITLLLYQPIANLIIKVTPIDEKLQIEIQEKVENIISENEEENEITNRLIESAKKGVLPDASKSLAINIIKGITMILLFMIARISLILIHSLADVISKLPIINQFNKLGGILYGLLRGVLMTYIILMVINLTIPVNPKGALNEAMQESYLAKTMSKYNILNIF